MNLPIFYTGDDYIVVNLQEYLLDPTKAKIYIASVNEDMDLYNGRVLARENGKARSEGKDYIVKDGDVILFFHN